MLDSMVLKYQNLMVQFSYQLQKHQKLYKRLTPLMNMVINHGKNRNKIKSRGARTVK